MLMDERKRRVCYMCEGVGTADDAHCPHCGWDGVIFAFDAPENDGDYPDEEDAA